MAEILLPISVQMEIAGAEHTASEIVKVAEAEKKVAKEAKNAQHETTNMFLALQATTSGLNQLSGGLNKVIPGLEAFGMSQEKAFAWQRRVRQFEVFTGSLEVMIAMVNIGTGAKELYAIANLKATASEKGLTAAIARSTIAVRANAAAFLLHPLTILVATLVGGGFAFNKMHDDTQAWNNMIEKLNRSLDGLMDRLQAIKDFPGNVFDKFTDTNVFRDSGHASGFGGLA